jgi:hypothetical protein
MPSIRLWPSSWLRRRAWISRRNSARAGPSVRSSHCWMLICSRTFSLGASAPRSASGRSACRGLAIRSLASMILGLLRPLDPGQPLAQLRELPVAFLDAQHRIGPFGAEAALLHPDHVRTHADLGNALDALRLQAPVVDALQMARVRGRSWRVRSTAFGSARATAWA